MLTENASKAEIMASLPMDQRKAFMDEEQK